MLSWCHSRDDGKQSTVLDWYGAQLREMEVQRSFSVKLFEMYVVSCEHLIQMTSIKSHEQLMADGTLEIFDPTAGNAMFISHQWAGLKHPDPTFEQFRVLQDSLKNIQFDGACINANVSMELYTGQTCTISAKDLHQKPLFVWYDYFSCPQNEADSDQRELAISSIPAFIEQCRFFVILCPNMRHCENEELLNKRTWKERGWCRLERLCHDLTHEGEGKNNTIEILSATYQAVNASFDLLNGNVGNGKFSKSDDLERLCPVLRNMLEKKLRLHLAGGQFHEYRILLNLQRLFLRNMPVPPRYVYIPGFESDLRWDHPDYLMGNFLYQNGFSNIHQRLEGWTPICFATMHGDPKLVQKLLDEKADVNDCITEPYPQFGFGKNMNLLGMAAYLKNNEVLKVLIGAGGDIHRVDEFMAYTIHWACVSGNSEGCKILLEAGSTKNDSNVLGYSPFALASSAGEIECMKVLLPHISPLELELGLHAAILHAGGSAEVVSVLIEKNVDIDHQLTISSFSVFGAVLTGLGLRHRWKESTLSTYAYHHYQATPLMCSILTGAYEVTVLLLAAGARTDLVNYRQKTALEIAYEVCAPDFVIGALQGRSDFGERLLKDYIDMARSTIIVEDSV